MTLIDLYASEPQYLRHVRPVWEALEPGERGDLWLGGRLANHALAGQRRGVPGKSDGPTLVASWQDSRRARQADRPVIYLEHGAGQSYLLSDDSRHSAYSGGSGHEGTILFLGPSEEVADRWRAVYPGVPAVAVGCPALDMFHVTPRTTRPATVAISFHANVAVVPESTSAWRWYDRALPLVVAGLRAAGVEVLGHGHPRLWARISRRWERLGVEPVRDFADVLDRASVYTVDNSSTGPEAVSCGLGLVWMNAPWYRREVHHGQRFWNWEREARVPSVDGPEDLVPALLRALERRDEDVEAWEALAGTVYAHRDGKTAQRAAEAIREAVGALV